MSTSASHLRSHDRETRRRRKADQFPSKKLTLPRASRSTSLRLETATAGDHSAIHRFLLHVAHGPTLAEYHAQLEDPFYDPSDRILVKRDQDLVAHIRLTKREMRFGEQILPVAGSEQLATLPEFRRQGIGSALLEAAEAKMLSDGAVLALARCEAPNFFLGRGWSVWPRHSHVTAAPRRILSFLTDHPLPDRGPFDSADELPSPLNIRLWRHFEKAALMRLYDLQVQQAFGPLHRSEAFWQWLIERRGYDRIYVAINGPDRLELDESLSPIVGYAVVREHRILELVAHPEHPDAKRQLLARACKDAIERDYHLVQLDSPPNCPLARQVIEADGRFCNHEVQEGRAHLAKVLDPAALLELLGPHLHARAEQLDLERPCELGLQSGNRKLRLLFSRKAFKVDEGKLGRSYLSLDEPVLSQLLLGHTGARQLLESGRIQASTRIAQDLAELLFTPLPVWRPPWDGAAACDDADG